MTSGLVYNSESLCPPGASPFYSGAAPILRFNEDALLAIAGQLPGCEYEIVERALRQQLASVNWQREDKIRETLAALLGFHGNADFAEMREHPAFAATLARIRFQVPQHDPLGAGEVVF